MPDRVDSEPGRSGVLEGTERTRNPTFRSGMLELAGQAHRGEN
jgi:hypothetical protein